MPPRDEPRQEPGAAVSVGGRTSGLGSHGVVTDITGARGRGGAALGWLRCAGRPRAFHSSSPLRLHAASLAILLRVSRYAQGLLLAERSRPAISRGHSWRARAHQRTPQTPSDRPPRSGGAVRTALTDLGSRPGRRRKSVGRASASRLRSAARRSQTTRQTQTGLETPKHPEAVRAPAHPRTRA